jgi:hypothetical protein
LKLCVKPIDFENGSSLGRDDLLEKQRENETELDLEYTTLSVNKLMTLLNKTVRCHRQAFCLGLTRLPQFRRR